MARRAPDRYRRRLPYQNLASPVMLVCDQIGSLQVHSRGHQGYQGSVVYAPLREGSLSFGSGEGLGTLESYRHNLETMEKLLQSPSNHGPKGSSRLVKGPWDSPVFTPLGALPMGSGGVVGPRKMKRCKRQPSDSEKRRRRWQRELEAAWAGGNVGGNTRQVPGPLVESNPPTPAGQNHSVGKGRHGWKHQYSPETEVGKRAYHSEST